MGVKKKAVHCKGGRGLVKGQEVGSTMFSNEGRDKDHPLGHSMKLEHFLGTKELNKERDNAYFKYLVHWKGVPQEDINWRSKNDVDKSLLLLHSPQGDLSSFFLGSMVQGTIGFMM